MSTTNAPEVIVQDQAAVRLIRLERPSSKNALTPAVIEQMHEGLAGARSLPEIRAVVLAGVPGAFCSGADVRWLAQAVMTGGAEARSTLEQFQTLTRTIVELEKPVIAAVTGPAVGFGADLALACDLRVMAESAYVQEKFVGIGLMPDGGGTYFLTRMLGVSRTLELLMTGARIDSAQAAMWGMAARVTPDAETEQAAL